MNLTSIKIKRYIKRKLVTVLLVTASAACFATLGDGGKKDGNSLKNGYRYNTRNFSLRSNYNFRANNLFSSKPSKYILLNTTVTYQKGNATYILPLKKKLLLDKIKFNPAQ